MDALLEFQVEDQKLEQRKTEVRVAYLRFHRRLVK
jgi:hypothetical protein